MKSSNKVTTVTVKFGFSILKNVVVQRAADSANNAPSKSKTAFILAFYMLCFCQNKMDFLGRLTHDIL